MDRKVSTDSNRPPREKWRPSRGSAMAIMIAVGILLCALFRQCYIAMPWDTTTIGGVPLAQLRRPLAVAFLTACFWGVSMPLGAMFWRNLTGIVAPQMGADFGSLWRKLAQSGAVGWLILLCTVCCLCSVLFPMTDESLSLPAGWATWFDQTIFFARQFAYACLGVIGAKLVIAKKPDENSQKRGGQTAFFAVGLIVILLMLTAMSVDWFYQGSFLSILPLTLIAYVATMGMATTLVFAPQNKDTTKWLGALLLVSLLFKLYFIYSQSLIIWYADVPAEQAELAMRHSDIWSIWGGVTLVAGIGIPALLCLLPMIRRSALALRIVGAWVVLASLAEAFWLIAPGELTVSPFSLTGLLLLIASILIVGLMVLLGWASDSARVHP